MSFRKSFLKVKRAEGDVRPKWSPDGRSIITNLDTLDDCFEHTVLLDSTTLGVKEMLDGCIGKDTKFAWSPDSKSVLVFSGVYAVVWDVETIAVRFSLDTSGKYIYTADWSPDGKTIAVGTSGSLALYDSTTGKICGSFDVTCKTGPLCVKWSNKSLLAAGYFCSNVPVVWDTTNDVHHIMDVHAASSTCIDVVVWTYWNDNPVLMTGHRDGSIRLHGEKGVTELFHHESAITGLVWCPVNKMVYSSSIEGKVVGFNLGGTTYQKQIPERILGLDISPDGSRLVVGTEDKVVIL